MTRTKQNVIIGGGISGMYMAYRLCQAGQKVTVIEKNNKLGGLLECFDISGFRIEKTYHHLFSGDQKTVDLINELGLGKDMGWYESSMAIYYENKLYPFSGAVDLLKFKPISWGDRVRAGLVSLYLSKTDNWRKFENMPACKYLKTMYGDRTYEVIWKPLLMSKFGKKYKQVSMAWMWARLNSRGNSKNKGVEKLGYLMGGFGRIVDKLAEKIETAGGKIMTGTEVNRIYKKADRIVVSYANKEIVADRVFACIDNHSLANLLTDKKYKSYVYKLKSVDYLASINLVFSSKQDLTDYYWNNINDIKSPFVAFVKHSQLVGKKDYRGNNIYYLGAYIEADSRLYRASDKFIKKNYFDYLKKIVPIFDKEKVIESYVFKYAKSQHLVDVSYKNKIAPVKTVIKDLFLINYSQIYPRDRGINWSIDQVDRLMEELKQ